jgi:hypothetical protein
MAANKYVLKYRQVEVNYTPGVTSGLPALVYSDGSSASKSYTPVEISTEQTALGALVSVALWMTIDTGGERFGFFLPQLDVPPGQSEEFRTVGIYEQFGGPDSISKPTSSWRSIELTGSTTVPD